MKNRRGLDRIHSAVWTVILLTTIGLFLFVTTAFFRGTFQSYVPVTLVSDRSGLVMEIGAMVKMRGVQVGRVGKANSGHDAVALQLQIEPDQIRNIPANVEAKISVLTAFGAKFVDLIPPPEPSSDRLTAGAVLHSSNVTAEVNTVLKSVADLLEMVDPAKLNAVLTAVADGLRGQGEQIGEAITDLHQVLLALNERSETVRADWQAMKNFGDTYDAAAPDILTILDAVSTTSETIVNHSDSLDSLLLNTVGLSSAGTSLLTASKDSFVETINTLEPTTNLLLKYNPVYTCTLQGATWVLDNSMSSVWGADGRSLVLDVALLLGNDPYKYPENLPVVAAKGGPGGQPGCGSLPDPTKNFPVRQLITDTGWGTGVDIRPNPGIGQPCWADYFPVTRAVPEPPSIRQCIPGPAVGPEPYPGAPPYGAPLYGPGGVPLWPGVPPADSGQASPP
ncbi:MCE family protein [Mycolicibacillus trivialis]|uniref:MCE-family protein MCE3A n=1 Tax=Mycolicibacillus trivialis TaxID=1798 RepID=A0A1X2EKH5_9MYCO|nr:MCE family protein [Mycolicibacillus trivialis]ORX05066.1 MCE-family protein MCE3A [Mycolicibacillus trivialis]